MTAGLEEVEDNVDASGAPKLNEWDGHFDNQESFREEARRWQLHRARGRIATVSALIAGGNCFVVCAFSAADVRGLQPGLQLRKEWANALASVGAACNVACAAACGADWPMSWWLAHGRRLLALQRLLMLALTPFLQAVGLQFQSYAWFLGFLLLDGPAVRMCTLACIADVTDDLLGIPPLALEAAAVAVTAALTTHPLAAPTAAAGALVAASLRRLLKPRAELPSAHAVASWLTAQQRSQADFSDFLAARQAARFGQVRATMAAAGLLCGAVAARGSLHGWHALYNGTATAAMLIVALLPSRYLAVLFRAWPSLWVAVSFVMLPFHAATQQCALGYDTSPAAACVRLKNGEVDPSQLLPFLVHCAVGPGLRLPGFSCYLFLLIPVFGFIVMEVPQLTALSIAERVELSAGFFVSALLAAHGVLCCDAAERDAHNQRERVRAEKAATKEFTRYILHEVRVPFNVVRLGVDAIQASLHEADAAGRLDASTKAGCTEVLTAMASSADSMSRIINDVLDLAKIEEGKLQLRHEPFHGGAVLADLSSAWAAPAADCGVTLTVALEPSAASMLSRRALIGDSLRLQQILNNLVSNALKFTPRGGNVAVRARARAHARSGPAVTLPPGDGGVTEERAWLILDVVDDGCGIAEVDLPHLFRPYSQLLSGLRRAGGTGLGLNLSRTLSTRCGGSLSCASVQGKGSTFTVRIPYALGTAPPEPPPRADAPPLLVVLPPPSPATPGDERDGAAVPPSTPPSAPSGVPPSNRSSIAGAPVHRALVVDDSAMSRMVLVRLLGSMGVAADAADGGQAGVDAALAADAAGVPYTVVFMDREMPPGLDGEAATRALRSAGCEVPIVALTGNALSDDRDSFFAAGCTAFLTKPATREHIAGVLRSIDGVLEQRRKPRRSQPWLQEAESPAEQAQPRAA